MTDVRARVLGRHPRSGNDQRRAQNSRRVAAGAARGEGERREVGRAVDERDHDGRERARPRGLIEVEPRGLVDGDTHAADPRGRTGHGARDEAEADRAGARGGEKGYEGEERQPSDGPGRLGGGVEDATQDRQQEDSLHRRNPAILAAASHRRAEPTRATGS